MRVRTLVYQIHSWLGLVSGIFLLVISLTGVALLFRGEIDAALSPRLARVEGRGERLSYDRLAELVQEHRLPGRIDALPLPLRPDEPVAFEINHDGRFEEAWIDPYSGRLLESGSATSTVSEWIDDLHYKLRGGSFGELWAGTTAFVLVLASATGLYIQGRFLVVLLRWPRRRTRLRDSHNLVGTWALLASLMFGLTGAWMCRFGLQRIVSPPAKTASMSNAVLVDRYLERAAAEPGFRANLILYPDREGEPVEVRGSYRLDHRNWFYGPSSYALVMDAHTGRVLSGFDPTKASMWATSDSWIFAIHTGQFTLFMPLWLKLLYTVLGCAPAFLVITGYWLYFRRLARQRSYQQILPRRSMTV